MAEHAFAFPVQAASMVSVKTENKLEKLIKKHCKFVPEEPFEDEVIEKGPTPGAEEPLEATEEGTTEAVVLELKELLGSLHDLETGPVGQEFSATLSRQLPGALVSPAIVVVTLSEISWMGAAVAPLREGVLYPAAVENQLIPSLLEALNATVQATLAVSEACGTLWGGNVLIALDARVPIHTLYQVMYTLGQARFDTMALVVGDADPASTRSSAPVGGELESGSLTMTSGETRWERPGMETVRWPRRSTWPEALKNSPPPDAVIQLDHFESYGTFVAVQDELAGRNIYCVHPGFSQEPARAAATPLAPVPSPVPLAFDPTGTLPVHIHEPPRMGGAGWYPDDEFVILRGDGARCSMHTKMEMLSIVDPDDQDVGKSLQEAFGSVGE